MIEIANEVVFTADIELLPDFVVSCVEVAMIVAVPAVAGVNTPVSLMVPAFDGLTDHLTEELKLPVPSTTEVQLAVSVIRMELGLQVTATDVIVGGDV